MRPFIGATIRAACAASTLVSVLTGACADTVVTGSVTWPAGVHSFSGNLVVSEGATLTLQPGCIVTCNEQSIHVFGTLQAIGTPTQHVSFTSTSSVPGRGDWRGIYLGPASSPSVLRYCDIAYGGDDGELIQAHGASLDAALYLDGNNATVTDCQILLSHSEGIEIWGGHPTIERNYMTGNRFTDYRFAVTTTYPSFSDNSSGPDGSHVVSVSSGSLAASGVWELPGPGIAYRLEGSISVPSGITWTLEAGVTIESREASIVVDGTAIVQGTPTRKITFTSFPGDKAPGAWRGLYLGPASGASVLEHCVVEWGGRRCRARVCP